MYEEIANAGNLEDAEMVARAAAAAAAVAAVDEDDDDEDDDDDMAVTEIDGTSTDDELADTEVDSASRPLSGGAYPPTQNTLMGAVAAVVRRAAVLVAQGTDATDAAWTVERDAVLASCREMLKGGKHNTFSHSYDYRTPTADDGDGDDGGRNYFYVDDATGQDTRASRNGDIAASFRRVCLLAVHVLLSTKTNTQMPETGTGLSWDFYDTSVGSSSNDPVVVVAEDATVDLLVTILEETHVILCEYSDILGATTVLQEAYERATEYMQRYTHLYSEIARLRVPVEAAERALEFTLLQIPLRMRNTQYAASMPTITLFVGSLIQTSHLFTALLLKRGCLGQGSTRFEYAAAPNIYDLELSAAATAAGL